MIDEDLDIFTNNEFSTVAVVDSATSAMSELSGIFDENYQDVFGDYSEGRKFCFQVQTTEVEDLSRGSRININGKIYSIVSFQPKHDGKLTNIVLKQD